MTNVLGYDITGSGAGALPSGSQAAGYTTGSGGVPWTGADWAAHPGAVRICQDPGATDHTADVLDVEPGAATNADAAPWFRAALANYKSGARPGQRLPCIYTSVSNVTALVNQLIADGVQAGPMLWVAHWGIGQAAAEQVLAASGGPFPIVGVQFADGAEMGTAYDWDVWLGSWLTAVSGPTPAPAPAPVPPPMPAGVPAAQVGQLLLNANGADMLAWQHSATGNQGQPNPGTYALDASGHLSLSIDGSAGSFCQVWGPAFGPHAIYEARCFLPDDGSGGIADWPAWWLYGGNNADELDIIEGLGGRSAVHLWWPGGNQGGGWSTIGPGWHTGTTVIEPGRVRVYIDGALFSDFSTDPLTTPMHVIHDIMAGAPPGTTQTGPPATYLVEYTRVWALATPVNPVPPARRNVLTPVAVDGVFGTLTCKAQQFVDFDGDLAACDGVFGFASKVHMQLHLGVNPDGVIGSVTTKALQRRVGAFPDGFWGPLTTEALQRALNAGTY